MRSRVLIYSVLIIGLTGAGTALAFALLVRKYRPAVPSASPSRAATALAVRTDRVARTGRAASPQKQR